MRYCLNCGKRTSGLKYCSKSCRTAHARKEVEKKKPPKFTVCQNPDCGKPLVHWRVTRDSKGTRFIYMQNVSTCNRECMGRMMHYKMKGKESNFQKAKPDETTLPKGLGLDNTARTLEELNSPF